MSQTDAIVLKANFEEWRQRATGLKGIDPLVYYCLEQFLKPYSLSDEEIQYGITDGGNDGGADAIYFVANQGLLIKSDTAIDPKAVSKVRVLFFQIKTSGGFKHTEIDKLSFLTEDFFDLAKPTNTLGHKYNAKVLEVMKTFKDGYLKLASSKPPEVSIDYYYVTSDDASPHTNAIESGERVTEKAKAHIAKAICSFHYIGAAQLWEQVQKRPQENKVLAWSEQPMQTTEGYVGLVKLPDYFAFLQDEVGALAERIFESNVRGFQPHTTVNDQITESLEDPKGANFWLLNNGITIIAPSVGSAGHLKATITDPQIVNGLQTSRSVFNYFSGKDRKGEQRKILVRIIETADAELQDMIIRATNSQNRMPAASLRMTDQIHRNIEALFKKYDLFYDRRKGFYRDQGRPIVRIISANELAQAIISIVLQRPDDARARPGDYFNDDTQYKSIFGENQFPIPTYLTCILMMRRVEDFLEAQGLSRGDERNLKFYVAMLLACELTGSASPTVAKLTEIADASSIGDDKISSCYARVKKIFDVLTQKTGGDAAARGTEFLKKLKGHAKRRYGKKSK